jgi:catechol 2,3-dioxygenase-like lactoylglutathione lyase family enzyme
MVFEHFAINVLDKSAAEAWYTEHLGLSVAREIPGEMSFLSDSAGRVVVEVYEKEAAHVLPFEDLHPLTFHVAFAVDDLPAEAARLQEAGATLVEGPVNVRGDVLAMLKDPFGMAIQLVHRAEPMT